MSAETKTIAVMKDGKIQCCDDPECDGKCLPKFSPEQLLDAFTRVVIPDLGCAPFWKAEMGVLQCSCTDHPKVCVRVSVDPVIEQIAKEVGLELEDLENHGMYLTKILGSRGLIPEPYLIVIAAVEAQEVLGTISVKTLDPRKRVRHK